MKKYRELKKRDGMTEKDYSILAEDFFEPMASDQRKRKGEILSRKVRAVDPRKTDSVADLVESYAGMSIQARNLGRAAEVLKNMMADGARPTVFLGLAGPLIAGGLRLVIREMIASGMVDVVVSTGAILYQDLYQSRGHGHFAGTPSADDRELRSLLINRIYDTYVDEEKFWETDSYVDFFADRLEPRGYSSREFLSLLSEGIEDRNSILGAAAKRGAPVFCPAINDSSIGIGLTGYYWRTRKEGRPHFTIDSIRDNYEIAQIVVKSPATAAIYVAGGVPKNYINDSVVMSYIWNKQPDGHAYAIQVTTDSPHWGGLSGSTLGEAQSWGKVSGKARFAMCFVEPTVSLPLLVTYARQRGVAKKRRPLEFKWKDDELVSLEPKGKTRVAGRK